MIRRIAILLLAAFTFQVSCKKKVDLDDQDNLYQFREYISFNTYGQISIGAEIKVLFNKPMDQFELNQELPVEYLKFAPALKGKLMVTNTSGLVFEPSEPMESGTEYQATLRLDKLFPGIQKELKTYSFAFKTLDPNFKINLDQLQSYSREWQYLNGTLQGADIMPAGKVKQLLKATFDSKNLNIKWEGEDTMAQYFNFTIDSIPRGKNDQKITISWDGKSLGADNKGSETFNIPGKDKFVVVDAKTTASPSPMLALNFSEPLDENQNLNGLVTIENAPSLRYEVNGNVLNVYPSTLLTGQVRVNVFEGLKNQYGNKLSQEFSELVSFEQLKPQVRLISKGTILPNADKTPIYFETVNLSQVEVRVIKIFQDNVLQHLQQSNLGISYPYDLKKVGRRVAFKVLNLGTDASNNQWKAHALDLSELINPDPGALYRIEFKFNQDYSLYNCENAPTVQVQDEYGEDYYEEEITTADSREEEEEREQLFWDNQMYSWRQNSYNWQQRDNPCHPAYYSQDREAYTHVLGSNLGLIVKKGNNNTYHAFATDLLNAQPQGNTEVTFYNYQQQALSKVITDPDGVAIFDSENQVAFVVARQGNNYAYAKLEDGNALSLSKFDVSGQYLEKGIQGFLYAERGVHRPGDTLHLTFVLDDKSNPLPENHPVVLEVTDPRGKLVERTVASTERPTLENKSKKTGNFYYFPIETAQDAPTGNWNAKVLVGGAQFNKVLKIATVKPNRLKIALDFDDDILQTDKATTGKANVQWLHGAPARNLKFEMDVKLRNVYTAFPDFENYVFIDPVRKFSEIEMPFFSGNLDNEGNGNFSKKLAVGSKAPGMLQATFTTKAFEGGGDFSMDVYSKNLAPFTHFAGLQAPEPDRWGSYPTGSKTNFDVVSVDTKGKASGNRKLEIKLFKIEWRWWWNRGYDNLSRYENSQVHRPMQSFSVTTGSNGKATFDLTVPENEGGRYLIRIIDEASGHATGMTTYFYKDWWNRPADGDSESAKILLFATDKEQYQTNEEAVITFPSSQGGNALVSIENGSEVLYTKWVDTQSKETKVNIPISPEMAPNVFVNISLLQPHGSVDNDLPIRLYGIVPILVENPETVLKPKLSMPDVLKPEESYTVKVSETNNKPMTYSLAVVDEGLLDLTRYTTPDIHAEFYAKQALGVKTFDIFDDVMGSYSVSVGNIYAVGGGDAAAGAKNRKAQRFKPVVTYLGPFELKAGQTATHELDMPNYVGAVKTMVVAGNANSAYGHADKSVPVRKPLMVLASIPRKLSPGEKVTIPVTVFAMEKKVKNAKISIQTGDGIKPLGPTSQSLQFASVGEQMVYFDFEVLPNPSIQKIKVNASGAGEKASYEIELDVENPNPISSKITLQELQPNASLDIPFETFGTAGNNAAILEFSTLPPMNLEKRLGYLIRYPHGCVEQTTSAVFPQLYLSDILDITFDKKKELENNVKAAIRKLGDRQLPEGGLGYWPGAYYVDDWGTSYAGHFMLEAKKKGFALPLTFMSNWLRYQKKMARQWSNQQTSYNSDLAQAYRLYTLALAGEPELSAMNRLREAKKLSNNAKWRLAAAYALTGKEQIAKSLAGKANIDFRPYRYDYHSYGSVFRNRAMALETMVILGDSKQSELAQGLAKSLNSSRWFSTQETAYALLALSKMVAKNGGKAIKVQLDGTNIETQKAIVQRELQTQMGNNSVSLKNNQNNLVYVNLVQYGKLPLGEELAESRGLQVTAKFLDGTGKSMDVSNLMQGTEITAQISVYNSTADYVNNIALTQLFPSGWEIVNTSFTDLGTPNSTKADYVDIRDDRVQYYFDLDGRKTKTFTIKLNASYMGDYYLPGAQAEAMYNNDYFARTKGEWITVSK
ncbi:alpha-2-macroglobulin family protein [Croceivirga thetidis]|uniref:Alpha-2-macroglobulin n=1 Tax=Croceivirga thetidis TaxID=2721623 RepID=A0ABX1GPB4_9FLAO|nr:MG2 domain-containing protein [Croceivirga thetidis]NKI31771.1 hypothetical protein [Croceivirga thetidis]